MPRSNFAKAGCAVLALVLLIATCLPVFNMVLVTSTNITFYITITRNGQEVPPDQIRSVRYAFSGGPPRSAQNVKVDTLRESRVMDLSDDTGGHWVWPVTVIMRAEQSTLNRWRSFDAIKDEASARAVLLRVEFTDGKTFSLSFPAYRRNSGELYVDFSDDPSK